MGAGDRFPPLEVVKDARTYWLVDGNLRLEAARLAGYKTVECAVRKGTRRDVLLASVGINATHGLQRSNADKRLAVSKLLADPDWKNWSDREIGRRCRLSNTFVSNLRNEQIYQRAKRLAAKLTVNVDSDEPRDREVSLNIVSDVSEPAREVREVLNLNKHGSIARMNVARIGQRPALSHEEAATYNASQRRTYFRETVDRLIMFTEWGVLTDQGTAIEVLMNIDKRNALERPGEAIAFIEEALDRVERPN
jgi:ParB-like chromosome segregation protein Spo0J